MDKRTVDGKKFSELETSDEKMLFLLEGIYDKLESVDRLQYKFHNLERHLQFLIELNIKQLQLQNKNRVWSDNYIKELTQRMNHL